MTAQKRTERMERTERTERTEKAGFFILAAAIIFNKVYK
jgi:hypothetical protein